MTLRELTAHYVKSYKKGPLSSETRKAYEELDQAILSQYRSYMKRFEDAKQDKTSPMVNKPRMKRRSTFEIK